MASRIEQLYQEDFYVWTRRQAEELRRLAETRPNLDLDFPHLIEEVEDLGTSQRDAVRSQLRRIIEHCLKLEFSAAVDPRGDAGKEIEYKLSPSLRSDLEEQLPRLWRQARTKADNGLRRFGEPDAADLLPADCPAFIARLDEVRLPNRGGYQMPGEATLTVLDASGRPTGVRQVVWPPEGEVRVVRAP